LPDGDTDALSSGEIALLVDGLTDDVSFGWALIHLGLREDPPPEDVPPTGDVIAAAFASFERLVNLGLVEIGRIEYVNPGQPAGSVAPVKHVAEPIDAVRARVERECAQASRDTDWMFACWLVNTPAGHERANTNT
jgi:hypothetical protein